ncbi:ATPase components of ABC transporters with duplicated ATPase domains [Halalkalibacter wakoensis JCM 9140]|uniref:ATPase components of ABC transporters with duplicated ATPase domains n=1 Tax=Halalkalibacter wakoensis JCM 9140 TaxID=1236970 RepID=W4Q2B8_9BACI|nr:ABC-F family ATP-binding cassette domain-containing protein [Halalkalibacter wakoensis]GAE26132.1 ATPase components of ABC transporters with duplicated ATPase domains [Halalkalibacter wakoensis JCM 9140]
MSMLQVEGLTKTYGDKTLFDHLSFTIGEKERIGLIGVNGTGKSTLLKILAGIESADKGEQIHANDFQIEYLPQQPELQDDLTVMEQIYYGESKVMSTMRAYEQSLLLFEKNPESSESQKQYMKWQQKMDELDAWEANTVAKTILSRLGITNFEAKIKQLSGGQKKRVAIAKALIQPADLLLLDEPTNHLDHETIEWLETFLSNYKGSILLITHDRYFLNRVTNHMYELDQGRLFKYVGNYATFLEKKAEREQQEAQRDQKRANILRREIAWLQRGAKARTTKQKARIQRVEALKEEESFSSRGEFDFAIGSKRLGKQVIELERVTKEFDDRPLIKSLDYLIVKGERLGIVGPNGSGKTTLLNMLAGRIAPDQGEITTGETVQIGYYTQEDEEIDGDLRMIDYIKEVAEVVYTVDGQVITAEQMLERFLFPRSTQYTYIRRLSGGERRRLYLLKVLMTEPNVLFLDEPTNDLDTETLSVLEDYLDQFPGVVITVSHDRYFLDRVVDHLLVFEGDGIVSRFQGHYTDYLTEKQSKWENEKAIGKEEVRQKELAKKEPRKKLSYKDQQEWNQIEDKITNLEEKIETVEKDIAAAGSDYGVIQEKMKEKEKLEQQLEETIERWTELSMLVEEIESGQKS